MAAHAVWHHEDWIQFALCIGTWLFGFVGAMFIWRQNAILHRQNKILVRQTGYMKNQRKLNTILIASELQKREREDTEDALLKIHLSVIKGIDAIDRECERLIDKGHSWAQLNAITRMLHNDGRLSNYNTQLLPGAQTRIERKLQEAQRV